MARKSDNGANGCDIAKTFKHFNKTSSAMQWENSKMHLLLIKPYRESC